MLSRHFWRNALCGKAQTGSIFLLCAVTVWTNAAGPCTEHPDQDFVPQIIVGESKLFPPTLYQLPEPLPPQHSHPAQQRPPKPHARQPEPPRIRPGPVLPEQPPPVPIHAPRLPDDPHIIGQRQENHYDDHQHTDEPRMLRQQRRYAIVVHHRCPSCCATPSAARRA